MFKTFRFRERYSAQVRLEAQDALNHAMFDPPNAAPTNTNFGKVLGVAAPEQRRKPEPETDLVMIEGRR